MKKAIKIYKVAIVGAGPAGYFTAQAFQKAQKEDLLFEIDLIERLPTPWGLVRSGVAPDHEKIKSVSKIFEKIAKGPNLRLFANVELGTDITLKDLRDQYDFVVLATGAQKARKLDIKGEDLKNSFSAAEFVAWYNSHPDFADLKPDLSCETAVVIGAGNVAMDVARMLLMDPTELEFTDIAEHALVRLKQSNIRRVIICGRRGPEHAAFTPSELRDLFKLKNTNIAVDSQQIEEAIGRIGDINRAERELKSNIEVMLKLTEPNTQNFLRNLEIKFLSTPIEIKGKNMVEEIFFEQNRVENGKVVGTNKFFSITAGLVITAIGYDALEYPGVTFEKGCIRNIAGHVEHNVYVVGWAKRGASGLIGTNKSDAFDVVDLILNRLKEPKKKEDISSLLQSSHQVVNQRFWEKINAYEITLGEKSNKPRVKLTDKDFMLKMDKF